MNRKFIAVGVLTLGLAGLQSSPAAAQAEGYAVKPLRFDIAPDASLEDAVAGRLAALGIK